MKGQTALGKPGRSILEEVDLADATLDLDVDGGGSLAVGIVGVLIAVVVQAMSLHGTQAAGSVNNDTDVTGEANGGLSDAALKVGIEILLTVTGEVEVQLTGPHFDLEVSKRNVAKMQLALASAHLNFQVERKVITEAQIPIVVSGAEVGVVAVFLSDVELTNAGRVHAVLDARSAPRAVVGDVGIESVAGAAIDNDFSSGGLDRGLQRLGVLAVNGAGEVLGNRSVAMAVGIGAAMPDKQNENNDESDESDGSARGTGGRSCGSGGATAPSGIPHFANADEDKNKRPIGPENRPRVELRAIVSVQENRAENDEEDGDDERASVVLRHGNL